MTVLTLFLMGGNNFFYDAVGESLESGLVHEILGMILFVLWVVHLVLNRAWIKGMLKGKYNALRIVRTVINCGVILCVLLLIVSGIILSNHLFAWLEIESGASFARTAHMLASHWYLFFVSLHIGLHLSLFVRGKVAMGVVSALGVYGVYAFIERGLWKYMTLQQPFFSVDLEHGYLLFTLDYIAIMALFAVVMQLVMQALNRYFYIKNA
jgi:cytochrome b subunit of formate dehydrogenase